MLAARAPQAKKTMCHLKKIDVQVSEQTEKARSDSTGSPGDPDFIFFFKFLKNAFRQSKISVSIAHTIFAIDSNIGLFAEYESFENHKRCRRSKTSFFTGFGQCVRYCRMPDVI